MNPTFLLYGIFLTANTLLSYTGLPGSLKIILFLVGILLPAVWGWRQKDRFEEVTIASSDSWLPSWGAGSLLILAILSIAARFIDLTTLLVWPNFDESSYGFSAIQLAKGAPLRFFYGVSQAPPLFIWGLGLWFKIFGGSLASLWAFPALISLTAVPLAYAAARTRFSRSFALLAAGLIGTSFWPVFLGRFALMTILVLPFECAALWALGLFFSSKDPNSRQRAVLGLGLVWGFGFYTHLHWPIVVLVTFIPFATRLWEKRKDPSFGSAQLGKLASLPAILVFLPLALAAVQARYGNYLLHLWAFNKDFSWTREAAVWLSCFTSPFWGMDPDVHTYQPVWGGFLNPVLTSLFFLGVLIQSRKKISPLSQWILLSLGLCLLPGLLTQDQETFRLFPILPFLILTLLIGLGSLMKARTPGRNLAWVLALGLVSLSLDAHHLFSVFHRTWEDPKTWGSYTKSFGRYRAYALLKGIEEKEGPGLIFPDFVQGLPDQTLTITTFDHNAVLNPGLRPSEARWAAVLTNVNYKPFLKDRFPQGKAYALDQELPSHDGGWMLFVFPTSGVPSGTLEDWVRAQKALEPFLNRHLCYILGSSQEGDLGDLKQAEPMFKGDPFLWASFLEKWADVRIKGGASQEAAQGLEKAAKEGLPAAHLYERAGILRMSLQERDWARKDFTAALHCPLDLTDSKDLLGSLSTP